MKVTHEIAPFYQSNSNVLILGSIPSPKSREQGFYYGHPQNRFWPVLANVFEEAVPITIEDRQNFLKRHRIALWDVLSSCEIEGASDSSIKEPSINDITLILHNTKVNKIFVTGKTAYNLYHKYIFPKVNIEATYLPSPSPANAKMTKESLTFEYQKIKL